MTSGILSNLARAAQHVAYHPDLQVRFKLGTGLLSSISIQNDPDGIFIAVDAVGEAVAVSAAEQDPLVSDRNFLAELHLLESQMDAPAVRLAREIALLDKPEDRLVAIEAAALELIQDPSSELKVLLRRVPRMRAENLGIEALQYPLPVHDLTPVSPAL